MSYISFNYKNSTLNDREQALKVLKDLPGTLLATCNRVELYQQATIESVRHLFRVAAGLESQILGEWEILGQVRKASTELLFKEAVAVGVKVRQETDIAKGNLSVASVAVAKANSLLDKKNNKVVLIGSGKVTQAILKNLIKRKYSFVLVANKTFSKAAALAKEIGGFAVRFDCLKEELDEADLVMSSTSAPHLILTKRQIGLRKKPVLIFDLALPRDVEPGIAEIDNVTLYNIDDIKEECNLNLVRRKLAAIEAEKIVEEEVSKVCQKLELAPVKAN